MEPIRAPGLLNDGVSVPKCPGTAPRSGAEPSPPDQEGIQPYAGTGTASLLPASLRMVALITAAMVHMAAAANQA